MSLLTGNLTKVRNFSKFARNFTAGKIIYNKESSESETSSNKMVGDVPGLSCNVVDVPWNEPVGPGASKISEYKNPEYYCYNRTSYFEAEVEMSKYRCPQPSVHSYYEQKLPK